jgi:hypothetical protein
MWTTRSDNPRIHVIRISGHLRRDNDRWTFLFLCDPFVGFADAHYIHDCPGNGLSSLEDWVLEAVHEDMSYFHGERRQ